MIIKKNYINAEKDLLTKLDNNNEFLKNADFIDLVCACKCISDSVCNL